MRPELKALIERLGWKAGDVRLVEPEGVEYTVRDEHGRVVEIVSRDGTRTYVEHDEDDLPGQHPALPPDPDDPEQNVPGRVY